MNRSPPISRALLMNQVLPMNRAPLVNQTLPICWIPPVNLLLTERRMPLEIPASEISAIPLAIPIFRRQATIRAF